MKTYAVLAALIAFAALGISLLSGSYRQAMLLGTSVASVTAIGSLAAMRRSCRAAHKPVQRALLVMVSFFLARIVLVALGTAWVARTGQNVFAFVLAFFVPYFAYGALEGAYVHALGRAQRLAT